MMAEGWRGGYCDGRGGGDGGDDGGGDGGGASRRHLAADPGYMSRKIRKFRTDKFDT